MKRLSVVIRVRSSHPCKQGIQILLPGWEFFSVFLTRCNRRPADDRNAGDHLSVVSGQDALDSAVEQIERISADFLEILADRSQPSGFI